MFLGEYQHSLDNKGRLTVPARFRGELGVRFVMTKGLDGCLFLYALDEWKNIEDKLKQLPMTNVDVRAFVRLFFSGAAECEVDGQGRVILPGNLREYAGIDRDITIIGAGPRAEIWARSRWDEYSGGAGASYDAIAEKLADLGI